MVPTEENIDVIEWVPDPAEFIYNAIVLQRDQVIFDDEDSKHVFVVVPDNTILAIGRRSKQGLAAHLTGYRIKSASEFEETAAYKTLKTKQWRRALIKRGRENGKTRKSL